MDFYLPTSPGEWFAWASGVVTVLFGITGLVLPRTCLRMMRLQPRPRYPDAIAEGRSSIAGFYIGVGVSAILLAQPLVWMALGAGWAMTAFGRLISVLADRGFTAYNLVSLLIEVVLAVAPLAYAFGYM